MVMVTKDRKEDLEDRSHFIGGSDARVIMGGDEDALIRLWQQKRGEAEPADLSGNLIVQLGLVTEGLNRFWFERMSGHRVTQCQTRKFHPSIVWMAATLDGVVEETGAVFESKFMLPWSFSEEAAAQKHMAQLQHNMMVAGAKSSVLSIITGGGKWVEMAIAADPVYQTATPNGRFGARSAAASPLTYSTPSRGGSGSRRSGWST